MIPERRTSVPNVIAKISFVVLVCFCALKLISGDHGLLHSSRQKRFLWVTHDRRLIFPPGTILDLKPTLQIPFLRKDEPPDGIHSDIQISWFFYIIFDELGLTHGSHPWPPFYPFGSLFGPSKRSLRELDKETVTLENSDISLSSSIAARKWKRDNHNNLLSLPSADAFPGGERAFIFPKLEQMLSSIGWQGRPCLLRLVCETHEYPLKHGYGLLGEVFSLFFTASKSDFAESHLPSYLEAEELGRSGNCGKYATNCKKSLFRWESKTFANNINKSSSSHSEFFM